MRRALLVIILLAPLLRAADTAKPKVTRGALAAMEASFDKRISELNADVPFELLGSTRGVYLQGFGAVFTAEVSLIVTPTITPFRQSITKEEIEKIRQRKLGQLPKLERAMRDMLVASAASLDNVPPDEQIVVGVTLFHYSWEDVHGMPEQLLMQAPRRVLLEYHANRVPKETLEASIRTEEF